MRFYFSTISSTDEVATDHILKGIQVFASVSGQLERTTNRDSFISCICKSALPVNYYANNLALLIQQHQSATSSTSNTNIPLSKTLSTDSSKEVKEDMSNGHSIVVRPIFIFIFFTLLKVRKVEKSFYIYQTSIIVLRKRYILFVLICQNSEKLKNFINHNLTR